jgi:hypothetical protein
MIFRKKLSEISNFKFQKKTDLNLKLKLKIEKKKHCATKILF